MASAHRLWLARPGIGEQHSASLQRRTAMACQAFTSRSSRLRIQCSSGRDGQHSGGRGKHRCRAPGYFEVRVVAPPPRSLGIYALPPLTHCDEEIEVEGQGFVVKSVVVQMKLLKGKYVRDHSRLDVTPTGRYFLEKTLENLLHAKYVGPTGLQD